MKQGTPKKKLTLRDRQSVLSDSLRATEDSVIAQADRGDIAKANRSAKKHDAQADRYAILQAQGDSADAVNRLKSLRKSKSPAAEVGGELTPIGKIKKHVAPLKKLDLKRFTPASADDGTDGRQEARAKAQTRATVRRTTDAARPSLDKAASSIASRADSKLRRMSQQITRGTRAANTSPFKKKK